MSKFPNNRRFEIIALLAIVVGLLLLLDIESILAELGAFRTRFSLTVWLGIFLICGGLLFLIYRLRGRFLRSARWRSTACPRCGGSLRLIHRHWYDRILSVTILPRARRYQCRDTACGWTGLLHVTHHHSHNT